MRTIVTILFSLSMASVSTLAAAQASSVMEILDEAVSSAAGLEIAQADIARARASAKRIATSHYEYEVSANAGQRYIDDPLSADTRFTEFGAGLSKTIRLPSKKRLDQRLSDIEIEISEIAVEVAIFDEKKAFIELWNAWSQAHRFVALSREQAEDAAALATLESVKVEKGAGRQINADILLAQSQMAAVIAQRDLAAANRAKYNLQSRYPILNLPSDPVSLSASIANLPLNRLDAIVDYPAQRLSSLHSEKMRLRARREALNKRPDPTLGLELSDEFGGRETSLKASISIPIGGKYRRAMVGEAQALAVKSEVETRLAYKLAAREYELAKENANSYAQLISAANASVSATRAAFEQMEKGYALGAITAQDLLIARKSLREAERTYADYVGQAEAAQLLFHLYISEK